MPADTREEEIFAGALELDPQARPVYLSAVCAKDPALRARIQALLAAHEADAGILDHRAGPELLQRLAPRGRPQRGPRFWLLAAAGALGVVGLAGLGIAAWLAAR